MEEARTISSMDGVDYLLAKLYRMPEQFREQYRDKEWAAAKNTYDTAAKMAQFLELSEEERDRLLGSRQGYPDHIIEGLFPERIVDKVYLECVVKRNLGFESQRTPPSPFYEYEKSQ